MQQTQEPQPSDSVSEFPVRSSQTDQTETGRENKRLAYIDGLRGLAVAGVVLFHARIWTATDWQGLTFLGIGRAGVDLFLVLTGFCLFLPLIRPEDGSIRPLHLREYVRRRTRRILPPYYVALLIAIAACALVYGFAGPSWWGQPFQSLFPFRLASLWDVGMHLTLAHGLNNHFAHGIDGAFWTLSLEAQFYTLFPLLVWVARREYITLAVLITILASLSYRYMMHENHPIVLLRFVGDEICVSRLAEFGLGMLAAAWTAGAWGGVRAAALKAHPAFLILTSAALLVTCGLELVDLHLYLLPLAWGLSCCLFVVCAGQPGRLRRFLEWPPLVGLGTISYSVYLLHDSVFRLMATVISRCAVPVEVRGCLLFFVGIPLTLAISVPFFRRFERPFLSRRSRDIQAEPHYEASVERAENERQASSTP